MFYLVSVLILIVSILLVLIVLVQNSKGGGLAANFSSSNQVMGVRKTTDFLEKATWTLVITLFVLCIAAAAFVPRESGVTNESLMQEQIDNAVDPSSVPFPTDLPAGDDDSE